MALQAVSKIFDDGTRGLEAVTVSLDPGAFVSLVGPSGCGKSTLLRLIAHLDAPTTGEIRWWGEGAEALGQPGRRLAFVFQDPTLMPWANVAKNVRLPLDLAGISTAAATHRVETALDQVGLRGRAGARPHHLSGGMRMRVSIARALVAEPDLLLMDEPFAALDEISRNKLDEDLSHLSMARGLTTVFVTHSIYEAAFLSSQVVVLSAQPGRIHAHYAIDAPRPRGSSFRLTEHFALACRDLSGLLRDATLASDDASP